MTDEAWGEPDDSPFDAASAAGWIDPTDLSKAMLDVMNERNRQQDVEGWTPEHDDQHTEGEMAIAAAVYALPGHEYLPPNAMRPRAALMRFWPWSIDWWKPKDRRRDLVRAGALIVAEIERLDRIAPDEAPNPPVKGEKP